MGKNLLASSLNINVKVRRCTSKKGLTSLKEVNGQKHRPVNRLTTPLIEVEKQVIGVESS